MKIKHYLTYTFLPILLFTLFSSCSLDDDPRIPGQGVQLPYDGAKYSPESIIVKLGAAQKNGPILNRIDGSVTKTIRIGTSRFLVIRLPRKHSVTEALKLLQGKTGFITAEPNYIYHKFLVPDDPDFGSQYAHTITSMPAAWDTTTGSTAVAVAVIDTGVNGLHPDLSPNMIDGYDCISNTTINGLYNSDPAGHGTHVAGIAAARGNNSSGVAGVAWNSKIMPVRVLDEEGSGNSADIAQGIVWAATNADGRRLVINLSLGGSGFSQIIQDAVQYAIQQNAIIVAAMGNDSQRKVNYPAYLPGVIAVGATDNADKLAVFSTKGKHISVCAPGDAILSTSREGEYVSMSGTSMATPYVAGICALLLSKDPGLTAGQIRTILELTAVDLGEAGFDSLYGHGRVDAEASLSFSATNRYGAILIQTVTPAGPTGDLEVLLCDANTNVIRSIRTSLGENQSSVSNGSLMFYYVPAGEYILRATWGSYRRILPVTVAASNTVANPALAIFELSYTESPISLGVWAEGTLNTYENSSAYYSLDVTAGQNYVIQWNEKNSGVGNYTLDVKASLYHADKSTPYFEYKDTGWSDPVLINATASEKIWLQITPKSTVEAGTYAVCVFQPSTNEVAAIQNTWMSNHLGPYSATYFYFDAVAGERYAISWDDQSDGSGQFTLDAVVSAYRADKSTSYFVDDSSGYSSGQLITALASERIYLFVRGATQGPSGSYAIKIFQPTTTEIPAIRNTWLSNYLNPYSEAYFYFDAIAGEKYVLTWDDQSDGSSQFTLDVVASAYRADKSTSYFFDDSYGYGSARLITAQANERVYLLVKSATLGQSGSYAIKILQPVTNESPILFNTWKSNFIDPYCISYDYFEGTASQYYKVYLDNNFSGSGLYSLYGTMSVLHANKYTPFGAYANATYTTPYIFQSDTNDRIYVKLSSYYSGGWGSFALKVEPAYIPEETLTLGSWHSNAITSALPIFYAINAVAGQMYSIQWDDYFDGSGNYSGDISTAVYCSDKETPIITTLNHGYSSPLQIVATNTGKLYIKMHAPGSYGYGSFAVRATPITDPSLPLSFNEWKASSITDGNSVYFYFDAAGDSAYSIQWDDYYGSGAYTAHLHVSALHGDRLNLYFDSSTSGYTSPYAFYVPQNERIYIKAYTLHNDSGTFAIKAYSLSQRALTPEIWTQGTLDSDGFVYYCFNAIAGQQYYIQWDDSYEGSGSYYLAITVSVYSADGVTAYFTDLHSGYSSPKLITATATGKIYIRVKPQLSGRTGTFGIRYYQ